MAKVTIDGKEYDTNDLSDDARSQLTSIKFVDAEAARLKATIAALQTARMAYARALNEILDSGSESIEPEIDIDSIGDTISFD